MRLPAWFLWAAVAVVISAEDDTLIRVKRQSHEKRIVCYYTNWSVYRPGTAKFSPQNINPYLCTHLVYAFGGLTKENALKPFDKYQDIEQGGYAKFNGLKTYNKNLKTMVAIGGWNEGSARFSPLVADGDRRKELVKNIIKFLRQNHFDGLDLDWEYPSFRDGGKPRDRDNYATLVQELREEFDRESQKTGRPRLLLTMAVPAGIEYIDKGYDVPKLNKYLDWMNILSYDYHSAFEPTVNHHAPLYSQEEDDEYNFDAQLNIDHTVQHYIKLGADRNKLVLGIPTYGRSYTLFNPDASDLGSAADGPGEQGEATREKGYLAYYEICERVKSEGWTVKNPNPEIMGPYAYKGNQWVGYDDEDIARAKAKYVNDNDLGGIMFWSIDNDDFRGKCSNKPYPLIEAAKDALLATSNELVPSRTIEKDSGRSSKKQEVEHTTKAKGRKSRLKTKTSTTTTTESPRTRTTPAYSTTTPVPPTTPDPGSDFVCKDEGFFPHPRDCKKYFWCLDSGPSSLGIVAHQFTCPSGLVFNKISDSCDYARNVICKNKPETSTTESTTPTTTSTSSKTTTGKHKVLVVTPSRSTTTTTTTTTTTEEPEEYEEYEEDEEDPGTIKELITLIKKLGGVEQLEKQLNLQESDEKGKIKPSLYNKVLNARTGNRFRGASEEASTSRYVSLFRNRPVSPQGSGTGSEEDTSNSRHHDKPQYVTIHRNRSTTKAPEVEEEEESEEEDAGKQEEEQEVQQPAKPFRRRPGQEVSTEKEYVTLRRQRPQKEDDATTPRYKSILRTRSTTEATPEEESEEEEEEIEEEPQRNTETTQQQKKYSSVIRDNKRIISEVEEPKVSGRQGPQYEKEDSTTTSTEATSRRNPVNTVNKVTTPKYVEIRRGGGHATTEASVLANDVNNVNSSEKSEENKTQDVLRRTDSTTEFSRRRSRLPVRTSTTTESITTRKEAEVSRTRGRFRVNTVTESTTASVPDFGKIDRPNRFRSRSREETADVEAKDDKPSQSRRRGGGSYRTASAESGVSTTEAVSRRFQFAPRSKPSILSSRSQNGNKTEESFTIAVPETTETANEITTIDGTTQSETEIAGTEPTAIDVTTTETTETNLPVTNFQSRKVTRGPKTTASTSTETSVVTSVTESLFTEKVKISVTKKPKRFKSAYEKLKEKTNAEKHKTSTTTEKPQRSVTKPSRFRISPRSTTTTTSEPEVRSRGFRSRTRATATTTTTTEVPGNRKFVPKRSRGYKKFTATDNNDSNEAAEITSDERTGRSRGKTNSQSFETNSLFRRTGQGTGRRAAISRRQKDDLDTQQSGAFYDDEVDEEKFLLGGTIKQNSGNDYINADFIFVTVPSVEEEEKINDASSAVEASTSANKIVDIKPKNDRTRKLTNENGIISFRGRVKAKDSLREKLTNEADDAVRENSGEASSPSFRSRVSQDESGRKEADAVPEAPEVVSTTSKPTTTAYRRNQDFLTNLRSRTRSTTQATTTSERSARRPGTQTERRRFRPEIRSTTSRPDVSTDSPSSNTTRNFHFPRRRTRPTNTTPTTTTTAEALLSEQQDDSRVEESKTPKDAPDLPDLADPAVVAIHNLATVSPGPAASSSSLSSSSAATTPVRFPETQSTFTIRISPSTETSPFSLNSVSTPANVFATKQGLFTIRPQQSPLTNRQFFTQTTQTSTKATIKPVRVTPVTFTTEEIADIISPRSEIIIQPRRQEIVQRARTTTTTTTSAPLLAKEAISQPRRLKPFSKVPKQAVQAVSRPNTQQQPEYEYYDDADVVDDPLADVPPSALKVKVHSDGYIECLDRGNFPHPFSCKKFISCAKMENNELLGWEYTCPKHLSFDPVGGICNWSAGLGCQH